MTETGSLLDAHKKSLSPNTRTSKSFIVATSTRHEIILIFQRCVLISLQMLCYFGTTTVSIIMIGQLPNSTKFLSGVGLSRTFVNVTGTAMSWGFTTPLFTLLPQSIGAGRTKLASIHIQRAFYIVTVIAVLLSVIQFFAGDIMTKIGEPQSLSTIIDTYCRLLIPYIILTSYGAILARLSQSLDFNFELFLCSFLMLICTFPLTWLFMYGLSYGYSGAAIGQCCAMLIYVSSILLMLVYKGFGYVFKPIPIRIIWTKKTILDYIYLAIPGLFQNAFEWIIQEVAVIFSGYVIYPNIALSTTVIISNLSLIILAFSIGISNATNLRVGKYIGKATIHHAKRAACCGVFIAFCAMILITLILILGRNDIPKVYTNNKDTTNLTSKIIPILVVLGCGCAALQTFGGIYRGLGFQKIAAIFVFISYWIISLPISVVLLFICSFQNNLQLGVETIWGSLAFGNVLATLGVAIYLPCFVNWESAVNQACSRIKHTIKEYQSFK
eukprot:86664_1